MNAAARLLTQSHVSRTWVISVLLSNLHFNRIVLILGVLISALSTIYVTNNTRSLHANLQQTMLERERLHIEWGQLLLEKSTWTVQSRVQNIAEEKLNMMVPDNKSIVIIKE